MSQAVAGERKNQERQNWTEITPQALYDKCVTLARNLWWSWHPEVVNLFRDPIPSSGGRSITTRSSCFRR
jgi:starch phosphorylase